MNYTLSTKENAQPTKLWSSIKTLAPQLKGERKILTIALIATLTTTAVTLGAPLIIAYVLDTYITQLQFAGVLPFAGLLLVLYFISFGTQYIEIKLMGGVGQRVIFRLREQIFSTLQSLPLAFFDANKTGDIISRINNDTQKLDTLFSQVLVRLVGIVFSMFGAVVLLLVLHFTLGLAAIAPAFVVLLCTYLASPWLKRTSTAALAATGNLSAQVSESLQNFKVVAAFNRRDFFREKFAEANDANYSAAVRAALASDTLTPLYTFATNLAQLTVLAYGLYLIGIDSLTIGILVSYLVYVNNLYNPLQQLASLWTNVQSALASWDRITNILRIENNLQILPATESTSSVSKNNCHVQFKDVSFSYTPGSDVLSNVSFELERGHTYALVGPTGGGKTTTASLMARLYDPTAGTIYLDGVDIRTLTIEERTNKIGFILQEPILFSGTIKENILYGNTKLRDYSSDELTETIKQAGLSTLLSRFKDGLDVPISTSTDALSLGQKQLIAFMRTVLREPELIILDEATANIDTVTEDLLEDILNKLPQSTTKVVIAHRLNTIENADVIYFVNATSVTKAGNMQAAVELLQEESQNS